MATWLRMLVGGLLGVVVGYVAWVVLLVPMSQGFSETAYQLRNAMELLGMNRLSFPWLLLLGCAAGGAVVGWGLKRR